MRKGNFYPPGVSRNNSGIQFVLSLPKSALSGIKLVIYDDKGTVKELDIPDSFSCGSIYSVVLDKEELPRNASAYAAKSGDQILTDSFAPALKGWNAYGSQKPAPLSVLPKLDYDWEGDVSPDTPFEDSVIYGLHVRGFTRHSSSKVKAKGTFKGIEEKLPYIKDLGVTAIELMPCYEFDELIPQKDSEGKIAEAPDKPEKPAINYWGYTESPYYFAVKSAYSKGKDPSLEFRNLVKACHREGIEVIMQFHFPGQMRGLIGDILRFWAINYHVDGFRLIGGDIPVDSLLGDPFLVRSKLIFGDYATDQLRSFYYDKNSQGAALGEDRSAYPHRNAAIMPFGFTADVRRFIKGEEDMLKGLIYSLKLNYADTGVINAITTHDGFTLRDLVSYDHKHNAQNGEDGRDGTPNNYSWNCGEEGPSRKKPIKDLRLRQSKNALLLMFLSQGTPYLRAGDEFGQTQKGNNNPYNQDNDTTYINWKLLDREGELWGFIKELIAFRRSHRTFARRQILKDMDYKSLGIPDISYHGEEQWKVSLDGHFRHIGILYNGGYVKNDDGNPDDLFYAAINMHWEMRTFSLPRLPEGLKWRPILCTEASKKEELSSVSDTVTQPSQKEDSQVEGRDPAPLAEQPLREAVTVGGRSICLFISEEDRSRPARAAGTKRRAVRRTPKDSTAF